MNPGHTIKRLLQENETVIVPGFGAFISVYKPAEIDKKNNKILPPSKEILFNQKIRNNDGLLVGFVAESEGISHFEALQQIENEREKMQFQLDKGEKVILEDLGTLIYDKSENIVFEFIQKENLLPEAFGLESVVLKEVLKADTPIETTPESVENEEPKNVEQPLSDITSLNKLNDWKRQEPEKEKKRSWIWLLFIMIPLIVVGSYIFLTQKKEKLNISETEKEIEKNQPQVYMEEDAIAVNDSIQIDSISDKEEFNITEQNDSVPVSNSGGSDVETKYYLVGGSFKEEENAEKYFMELKEMGYNPFHLGKKGNFFLVGINTYYSEREALKEQRLFLENNPGSGAWVYIE